MIRRSARVKTPDGIDWYYEQEGSGPQHVVVVPCGLGDCGESDRLRALVAATGDFTVTTFDMPGFSRTSAPPEAYEAVSAPTLAAQIASLLDVLLGPATSSDTAGSGSDEADDNRVTIFGASSGGTAALALAALHPARVRNAMPHEVPLGEYPWIKQMVEAAGHDDKVLSDAVAAGLEASFPSEWPAWVGLGEDYLARVRPNYARWARCYDTNLIPTTQPLVAHEQLLRHGRLQSQRGGGSEQGQRKGQGGTTQQLLPPIDWTVGADSPAGLFIDNIVAAAAAGIPVSTLPGSHFAPVSQPEAVAEHIIKTAKRYL